MVDPSSNNNDGSIQVKIDECSIEVKQGFHPLLLADVVKVLKTLGHTFISTDVKTRRRSEYCDRSFNANATKWVP
ncbi:hypothetical protein GGR02_001903 [Anoxybacillus voinovskiensis]|uniref:Uncharacterized protein n=2 Tax=Anoxybacteroides voinovskiense TaxID=230470 RepID=A0A840DVW0_9BACL|nr:hypothetical protein [Anoxybacillus voinovskiensis]MBB4074138.1 hypothetical protein [Anoxybacillus voinovskiensis]GGJ56845.1 hypothetical protein GCM10008982_02580 [Anoxybacillus voinovskiensis]